MARDSYMPSRKAEQVAWATHINTLLSTSAELYGVPAGVADAFNGITTNVQMKWQTATTPATRTKGSIAAANDALKAMRAAAQNIVGYIQATATVTDQMKIDAGVTVRKTHPSPIPPPHQKPYLVVTNIDGRKVTLELRQAVDKRSKPPAVAGATILSSTTGAMTAESWQFKANTTKTKITIPFPPSETGDTVYVTAFWTNAKDQSGPAADPIAINLPAGGVVLEKQNATPKLKVAA